MMANTGKCFMSDLVCNAGAGDMCYKRAFCTGNVMMMSLGGNITGKGVIGVNHFNEVFFRK